MSRKELVFIHGWVSDSSVWREVGSAVSDICRVHLIDLPPMSSMHTYRDAVINFIADNEIERACLVGWSLGSLVVLQVVESASQLVSGLVLVSGTARFTKNETYSYGQPADAVFELKRRFMGDAKLSREAFFRQVFSRDEIKAGLDKRAIMGTLINMRDWTIQEALAGLDFLIGCDMIDSLPGIFRPALVMHGDRDRVCLFGCGKYLHRNIADSQLSIFQGAGHAPFLTQPALFIDRLREWLLSW